MILISGLTLSQLKGFLLKSTLFLRIAVFLLACIVVPFSIILFLSVVVLGWGEVPVVVLGTSTSIISYVYYSEVLKIDW